MVDEGFSKVNFRNTRVEVPLGLGEESEQKIHHVFSLCIQEMAAAEVERLPVHHSRAAEASSGWFFVQEDKGCFRSILHQRAGESEPRGAGTEDAIVYRGHFENERVVIGQICGRIHCLPSGK